MDDVTVFNNPEFGQVRTVEIDGEPYFVGKDVAKILGYKDTSDALKKHVDMEDKLTRRFADSGQEREMYIINESGLYSLILSSKLPKAKEFKHWVTSEVLPDIRKHGMFAVDEIWKSPDFLIETLLKYKEAKEEKEKAQAIVEAQKHVIADQKSKIIEMKPKVTYYDIILQSKDLVPISVIAKDYGWSATKMNKYLHEQGIQFKQGNIWLLYTAYAENGYTGSKTHVYDTMNGEKHIKAQTCWTQKGRKFIYDLLKSAGIIPLIEQMSA